MQLAMLVFSVCIGWVVLGSQPLASYHPGELDREGIESNSVRSSSFPTSTEHQYSLCILDLASRAGADGQMMREVFQMTSGLTSTQQTEMMRRYALAMMHVESRFNQAAISPAGAVGIMQLTAPAVQDCGGSLLSAGYSLYANVLYGLCYLELALLETDRDWRRSLIMYNGGYRQLDRYDRGLSIASETANYVLQVERVYTNCTLTAETEVDRLRRSSAGATMLGGN